MPEKVPRKKLIFVTSCYKRVKSLIFVTPCYKRVNKNVIKTKNKENLTYGINISNSQIQWFSEMEAMYRNTG